MTEVVVADKLGAQIVECWTLSWPEIRMPHYRTGRVGAWELKRQFQPVLRGYFRGLQAAAENYVLTRDDRVWMSLSPVETESLAPHVPFMRGHVVIAGLGMGIVRCTDTPFRRCEETAGLIRSDHRMPVNAGEKMHRRAGVKMHHGWMPNGRPREAFFCCC